MALLTVTEAARLTRRSRTSIYRDMEKGRLDKVYTADGSLKLDSAELVRAYGPLPGGPATGGPGASPAATDQAIRAALRQVTTADAAAAGAQPAAGATDSVQSTEVAVLRERLAACEHRIALLERIAHLEKAARLAADASWRERVQAKDQVIGALSTALANGGKAAAQPDKEWPAWHRPGEGKRAIN